jgi:NADPH2:quinone reductase
MRAVVLSEFGPPEVLVPANVADPVPGPGEIVIDVAYANVTFVETQVRAGRPPNPAMLPRLPTILGNGVGGVVSAVGDATDPALIGRRVVASLGGSGGYAGKVAIDSTAAIGIPDRLSMENAVALLADGRTAILLVRAAAIHTGETVLVEAAAGGVGSLLVQLAHTAGARVVGAAGRARKLSVARDLGADAVVDYSTPDWPDRVRREVGDVHVVFDGVGGETGRAAFELLRPGGRFAAYGMASGAFAQVSDAEAKARGVTVIGLGRPTSEAMRDLVMAAFSEAVAGRLRPLIGQIVPLDRAAGAHAAMERRETIGKTLLDCARSAPWK